MQVFIRTASKRDIEAVRALLRETWHDTYDTVLGRDKVSEITADWHSTAALEAKLNQPHSEFVLADTGTQIVGMAFASLSERSVKLHQLYVLPAAQGSGAGTALLQEVFYCFDDADKCVLDVESQNTRAVRFYEAHGFTKVGETQNCGAQGSGIPAIIMEIRLSDSQ